MSQAIFFALGVVLGAVVTAIGYERIFRLVGRYATTGSVSPPQQVERMTTASPEAMALKHMTEDSVQVGVEQFLVAAAAAGMPMTRKQAEVEVRKMMDSADPLGGVN